MVRQPSYLVIEKIIALAFLYMTLCCALKVFGLQISIDLANANYEELTGTKTVTVSI